MDDMALAQLKRQAVWFAQEVRHTEQEYQATELALETYKRKVEDLRKKLTESKRRLDILNQDIVRATDENRKRIANERRQQQ